MRLAWPPQQCVPSHLLQHALIPCRRPRPQLLQLQRWQVKPQPLQLLCATDGSQLLLGCWRVGQQAQAVLGLQGSGNQTSG